LPDRRGGPEAGVVKNIRAAKSRGDAAAVIGRKDHDL
jgi:hypothetical protein